MNQAIKAADHSIAARQGSNRQNPLLQRSGWHARTSRTYGSAGGACDACRNVIRISISSNACLPGRKKTHCRRIDFRWALEVNIDEGALGGDNGSAGSRCECRS